MGLFYTKINYYNFGWVVLKDYFRAVLGKVWPNKGHQPSKKMGKPTQQ